MQQIENILVNGKQIVIERDNASILIKNLNEDQIKIIKELILNRLNVFSKETAGNIFSNSKFYKWLIYGK